MNNKIGFACKYYHPDRTLSKREIASIEGMYNTKTTTHRVLQGLNTDQQYLKLSGIIEHNLQSIVTMFSYIENSLPERLWMYRISSDVLPLYTHPQYKWFWQLPEIQKSLEQKFLSVGEMIRSKKILVSFHPGQFVVLASDREEVVTRSIEEFEYHVDMARWMGFGQSFQDGCKINVHIGGGQGPVGFLKAYQKLSPEARNLITVENDEFTWGLDHVLELKNTIPIVLDIHHHWINSGEYINSQDDRVKAVVESWKGKTPTMHYSSSPESLLVDKFRLSTTIKPSLEELLKLGLTKSALRAHSNLCWNSASNHWALEFASQFNIMCEAKAKHNAALQLHNQGSSL